MSTLHYTQKIDVYGEYDVAVIGGGPAGVCAAVSAARSGMRVLPVESTAKLGGMATSGGECDLRSIDIGALQETLRLQGAIID